MSASSCLSSLPSALGASVWRADELAGAAVGTVASGHAALDAELPGGGWPLGALIELLQPARDAPVWSLLLPAVVARQQASGGAVVLVNPPHEPFLPALRQRWRCVPRQPHPPDVPLMPVPRHSDIWNHL